MDGIGYSYRQHWELRINDDELIAKELYNDGLVGVFITSVSSFIKFICQH